MMSNNLHNLMAQLVQENKSLWRIRDVYLNDAEGEEDCLNFWKEMEADKQKHIEALQALIKSHLN